MRLFSQVMFLLYLGACSVWYVERYYQWLEGRLSNVYCTSLTRKPLFRPPPFVTCKPLCLGLEFPIEVLKQPYISEKQV